MSSLVYTYRSSNSSLLPIIVSQRRQREIFPRRLLTCFRILPVQDHLADQNGVANGSQEVTPPDETVPGLLARGEDSDGTPEERVEDGESGEVAGRTETMVGSDLRRFG
jgi:hypothetical protein